jgi:hypothetical protein
LEDPRGGAARVRPVPGSPPGVSRDAPQGTRRFLRYGICQEVVESHPLKQVPIRCPNDVEIP